MRSLILVLVASTALAGCLGGEEDGDDGATPTPTPEPRTDLPDDFEHSEEVIAGASPGPALGGTLPESGWCDFGCIDYPVTVDTTATLTLDLTWVEDESDFDLVVYQGEEAVASSGNPQGQPEHIEVTLEPGEYAISVVPFSVVRDTFTLTGTWS